ncbi:hypothetical protein ACHAW6_001775 [Cyclotella cf. meneghiniana]
MQTENNGHPSSTELAPPTGVSTSPIAINAAVNVDAAINNSTNAPTVAIDMAPSDGIAETASAAAPEYAEPTASAKGERKAKAERRREEKQKEKEAQQQSLLEVMKNCPFEAIQLTHDGSDVLTIGDVLWADVDLKCSNTFLKHKNIKYGRQRGSEKLGSVIVQYLKARRYKNALEGSSHTSNPAVMCPVSSSVQRGNGTVVRSKTRPVCLLVDKDSTLYWVANVLREHKSAMLPPRMQWTSLNLSGVAHPVEWVTMTNAYNKAYDPAHPDTSIDCVYQYTQFDVFGVDEMAASEFDENLSVVEFMEIVGYMEGQDAACVKISKVSGDHGEFMEYNNGLIWLAYMRCWFMSVGDSSLQDTVFAELPDGVLNESTSGARGARNICQSSSPIPPGSNRKLVASLAIQGAVSSVNN